jgi:hypothetical protein
MEKYNRVGIKQLIKKHPEIGELLLNDYKINCMRCKGNCDLKNVVEEENLSLKDEMILLNKITDIIASDEKK